MGDNSGIEWTESTWNPLRGKKGKWWCSKIRPGCKFCYAESFNRWRGGPDAQKYRFGLDSLQLHEETLQQPLRWRRPRLIFVCSMTDLFHPGVPDDVIRRIFEVMGQASHHTFQVLTKHGMGRWHRDDSRLLQLAPSLPWAPNIWMGATLEHSRYAWVADRLREVPAAVRWISAEPLLSSLSDVDLEGIDWLVAGGESGRSPRPMDPRWPLELRDQCKASDTAYLFKQWGGRNKKAAGRILDGRTYDEYPTAHPERLIA